MIYAYEEPNSRPLDKDGCVLRYSVITTAGETEAQVFYYVLAGTFPFFNGFIRQNVRIDPNGAPHMWKAEVPYGVRGVNGGDQPFGGVDSDGSPPAPPVAPETPLDPLTMGYAFSVRAQKKTYLYSRATISAIKRGSPDPPPNFMRAIGVDSDGKVAGVEWPPEPSAVLRRTVARPTVTQGYLSTLFNLAGRTNNASFYGWDIGDALFLSAEGQYTQTDGWSITFEIGVQEHETDIEICPGLTVPAKRGWEYLWVKFGEIYITGDTVTVPQAAYVEQIVRPAPFALLGIGA